MMNHMKFIYVLTSSDSDYYLEQLAISIHSLRIYHPNAYIGVLVDKNTKRSLNGKRLNLLVQASEIIVVDTPTDFSQMQCSRFIKTSIRNLIDGDFLFIDTDTVICGNLLELENYPEHIYAVPDLHVRISRHTHSYAIAARANVVKWDISNDPFYFNSGIVYVKDNTRTREFYTIWNSLWQESTKLGCSSDQPAFCKANEICGSIITELPGIYNCQVIENGVKFLKEAKVIHYFASNMGKFKNSSPFKLKDNLLYESIKQTGEISPKISHIIANPKNAFADKIQLITECDVDFFNSPICQYLRKFYYKFPAFYEGLIKSIRTMKRKLHPA